MRLPLRTSRTGDQAGEVGRRLAADRPAEPPHWRRTRWPSCSSNSAPVSTSQSRHVWRSWWWPLAADGVAERVPPVEPVMQRGWSFKSQTAASPPTEPLAIYEESGGQATSRWQLSALGRF